MKALVLSCDRYHVFAEHMICTYARHWPDHPFVFYIPYQQLPAAMASRLGDRAKFIKSAPDIRPTLDALLSVAEDDEWIYWCIDDKYVIELDRRGAARIASWAGSIKDPTICGVSFARARRMLRPEYLSFRDILIDRRGGRYFRRIDFSQIWLHQFLRARVLKDLFAGFPCEPFQAKAMDAMKEAAPLPPDQRLYVSEANHVVFGESTTRGALTSNCRASLLDYGIEVPSSMLQSDASITIGQLDQSSSRPFRRLLSRLGYAA